MSGISSITSNGWMIKLDWPAYFEKLPALINGAFEFILEIEKFQVLSGIVIILSALVILINTKNKKWFWLILFFFLVPIILLTIQRLQPYHRIWIYLIFPMSICVLIILDWVSLFLKKAGTYFIIICCITTVAYTLITFYKMTEHKQLMYENVERITSYIVSQNDVKVYTNDDSYGLFLRYQSSEIGKRVIAEMNPPKEAKDFDYVLLKKKVNFPSNIDSLKYNLHEKDDYIVVYKHK